MIIWKRPNLPHTQHAVTDSREEIKIKIKCLPICIQHDIKIFFAGCGNFINIVSKEHIV